MIIPWVNWFWKRKPNVDVGLSFNLSDRVNEFTNISREYDERLYHFETKLNEDQFKEFMDLRNCANRVVLASQRMGFAQEHIDRIKKDFTN